ncbi:MAG: DNA recombination protein RmuC [Candidatus Gracilibacteria bacterium]|nr:DNA recombination protein RmuC [Candidatus Gracilibacteria bacterium]
MLESIIILLVILLAGAVYFAITTNSKKSFFEAEKISLEKTISEKESTIQDLELKRSASEKTIVELTGKLAGLDNENKNLLEKVEKRKQEIEDTKKEFKTEFENIANKILESNRVSLTKDNREQVDILLKPLKEKLETFQKEVKENRESGIQTNASLMEQIKQLTHMNQDLANDAKNLTKALRGDSKTQGDWGELVLEDLLEKSGLRRGSEYVLQGEGLGLKSDTGTPVKPDVLIILPEGKTIVVDSKVSLTHYERFVSSEEEAEKKMHLSGHLASVKSHIDELAKKDYPSNADLRSPDFTMMFVPIEASLTLALTTDGSLFTYAWDRKIVLVSPTTLLISLKTVATLWRHEKQTKNVLEIARIGGQLYEKFIGFLGDMEGIKKALEKSLETHDQAIGKLKTGKGSITSTIERLKTLGAKTEKQLDGKHLEEEVELIGAGYPDASESEKTQ